MKSIIDMLYNGEINEVDNNSKYSGVCRERDAAWSAYEKLEATLDTAQKQCLDDFLDKNGELHYREKEIDFMRGFKMGMRLALEVLEGEI